jgi:formate dehydrogenase iron-sulfur subunit
MREPMGFYTDTTVCIGCKACEVACKEWNQLPARDGGAPSMTGDSYDNTGALNGINWRHVKFVEQISPDRAQARWLMMSDVCKHCVQAGCLEVCPTGAIIRTEFDTVVIQSDVCNGCQYCIGACPFDVIDINPSTNTAMKCTLCYDRMVAGLIPACAQACPTASIQYGPIAELRDRGAARVEQLQTQGTSAYLYGADERMLGGLNSFYLLVDRPSVYGLPDDPKLPTRNNLSGWLLSAGSAVVAGVLGLLAFRKGRMDAMAAGGANGRRSSSAEAAWADDVQAERSHDRDPGD